MNNRQIFDMIGCLDDKYILEADGVKGRRIKMKKRFIGFMAAAAIAVTGAVGVGAGYIAKQQNRAVDSFLGESAAEQVDSKSGFRDIVISTEHIDVTIESVLFDGSLVSVSGTTTPKDDEGKRLIDNRVFIGVNGEKAQENGIETGGGSTEFASDVDYSSQLDTFFVCDEYDSLTLPMCIGYYDGDYKVIKDFELNIVKNMECVKLYNKKNEFVRISELGLITNGLTLDTPCDNISTRPIRLEFKDGSEKEVDAAAANLSISLDSLYLDHFEMNFMEFVSINDVTAINIGGTRLDIKE